MRARARRPSPIEAFRAEHPFCCFCGGEVRTEQIDHVPPRAIFDDRVWPDGYAFPACAACNQGSRQIDQVAAMLARMSVADRTVKLEEFQKYRQGVSNNVPSALPKLVSSQEQQDFILEQIGLERAASTPWQEVPMVMIEANEFRKLDVLLGKLFCALYYKHVGRILPRASKLMALYTTNQILSADDPYEWQRNPLAQNEPVIARNGKELRHQFDYKWGHIAHDDTFAVSFQVRYSVFGAMVGPILDTEWARIPEDLRILSSAP
jgi:hypothetical protein